MKKNVIQFIVLLSVLGCLIYVVYQHKQVFEEPIFQHNTQFETISKAVTDEHFVYFLDKSLRRIGKVDKKGSLHYLIHVGDREKQDYHLTYEIVVDQKGNLYALNLVLDEEGIRVKTEEIVKYSADGKFLDVVFQYEYPLGQRPYRPGQFKNLKIRDNLLYFYSINDQKIVLHKQDLQGGKVEQVLEIELPEDTYLANIVGVSAGSIYYTTKRAELYQIKANNEHELLYSGNGQEDGVRSFPVHVDVDLDGKVLFTDIGKREVNRIQAQFPALGMNQYEHIPILTGSKLIEETGLPISLTSARSLNIHDSGFITVATENEIIGFHSNGEIEFVMQEARYPISLMLEKWLYWLLLLLIIALIIYLIRFVYVEFLNRRVSIIIKQSVVFIPLIIVALVVTSGVVYQNFSKKFDEEIYHKLKLLAHVGSLTVDIERMERIKEPKDFMNEDFLHIHEQNHFMFKGNEVLDAEALYSSFYFIEDDQPYVLMYYNSSVGTYYPVDSFKEYLEDIKQGNIVTGEIREAGGEWMFALAPLYNQNNEVIGMQEVGMITRNYIEYKKSLLWTTGKVIILLTPIMVVVFLLMTFLILSSIRVLRNSVNQVASGNWDTQVEIKTRDEVAELGERFNFMADYIRKYIAQVTNLSQSYFRFVPQQFLTSLGRESILDIQLGDQVELESTLMVANIRSFYQVTEQMSSEEKFNLINSFAKGAGPVIRQHGGLVNKYQGAGILALFPEEPVQAVRAALEMNILLKEFNKLRESQGEEPIYTGIGLHKGPSIIGVIGEDKRLESTIISDHVNVTTIIEKLTAPLGASVLLSEDLFRGLPNPEEFLYRDLGMIELEDRKQPMRIYDLFEQDPEQLRNLKARTKERFEEGILCYQEGRFFDARTIFIEIIRQNPEDKAARLYFYHCDEYFLKGTPDDWKGALQV